MIMNSQANIHISTLSGIYTVQLLLEIWKESQFGTFHSFASWES